MLYLHSQESTGMHKKDRKKNSFMNIADNSDDEENDDDDNDDDEDEQEEAFQNSVKPSSPMISKLNSQKSNELNSTNNTSNNVTTEDQTVVEEEEKLKQFNRTNEHVDDAQFVVWDSDDGFLFNKLQFNGNGVLFWGIFMVFMITFCADVSFIFSTQVI